MCDSKACYCKQNLPSATASGNRSLIDMMRRQSLARKPSIRQEHAYYDSLYDSTATLVVEE